MMHSLVSSFFLVVLEQREVRYPEELEVVVLQKTELSGEMSSQEAERVEYDLIFVRYDQDEIAFSRSEHFAYLCKSVSVIELVDR